jgi:peptide-methionine (R)-S-oxide reductase
VTRVNEFGTTNDCPSMKKLFALSLLAAATLVVGCNSASTPNQTAVPESPAVSAKTATTALSSKVMKSDEEWKKELTPEQYRILRKKGTERAFTGAFWNTKDEGTYKCAGCGEMLFASDTKYDSGCGWPSFYAPANKTVIAEAEDNSHFMQRIEVLCAKCGGHLGHVFDDGPQPTGLRYCINSAALTFEPKTKAAEQK